MPLKCTKTLLIPAVVLVLAGLVVNTLNKKKWIPGQWTGIDFMQLYFGRNVFGQIIIVA
jgi:hypothetical protein